MIGAQSVNSVSVISVKHRLRLDAPFADPHSVACILEQFSRLPDDAMLWIRTDAYDIGLQLSQFGYNYSVIIKPVKEQKKGGERNDGCERNCRAD